MGDWTEGGEGDRRNRSQRLGNGRARRRRPKRDGRTGRRDQNGNDETVDGTIASRIIESENERDDEARTQEGMSAVKTSPGRLPHALACRRGLRT